MSTDILKVSRSSYSIGNAIRFKAAFDKAIETGKDVIVPVDNILNMKPVTLRNRIGDALLWFASNDLKTIPVAGELKKTLLSSEYNVDDYKKLKSSVQVVFDPSPPKEPTSIRIRFRNVSRVDNIKHLKDFCVIDSSSSVWRDRILDFLSSDEDVLILENLSLTPSDREWLSETQQSTGVEMIVGNKDVKILK